jgi:hypothetical protein
MRAAMMGNRQGAALTEIAGALRASIFCAALLALELHRICNSANKRAFFRIDFVSNWFS